MKIVFCNINSNFIDFRSVSGILMLSYIAINRLDRAIQSSVFLIGKCVQLYSRHVAGAKMADILRINRGIDFNRRVKWNKGNDLLTFLNDRPHRTISDIENHCLSRRPEFNEVGKAFLFLDLLEGLGIVSAGSLKLLGCLGVHLAEAGLPFGLDRLDSLDVFNAVIGEAVDFAFVDRNLALGIEQIDQAAISPGKQFLACAFKPLRDHELNGDIGLVGARRRGV